MAVDIFLKLDGIKGESKDDFHKDEIDVFAFSWGAGESPAGTHGVGGGGSSGKVSVHDISFTKGADKASPRLFQYCCGGKHIPNGILSVRKAGDGQHDYLEYKFYDLLVSSYQLGGSSEELPTESLSINFSKMEMEYKEQQNSEPKRASCSFSLSEIHKK